MELNKTSQYAIRILSYISNNDKDRKLYSAKEISETLDISYKFLTKIMTNLVKAGFVHSIRGRDGGFELSRPSNQIKLIEILETFNETVDERSCILGIGNCDNLNKCALHDQWVVPKELIKKMFEGTTLENLEGSDFKL